jgi:pimeloyl-ACP methyl ester carboxylesterase
MRRMGAASDPTVLLVHGAWHGAWCFAALQAELDRRGIASHAVDLPGHGISAHSLGDLYGDADAVAQAVQRIDGPVVLLGHSYGGAVITEAASRRPDRIAHLVYLTAFALDAGESIMSLLGALPRAEVALSATITMADDGTSTLTGDGVIDALYGQCPPGVAAAALRRIGPQPMITFTQPVSGSPRARIVSTYVRCTEDRAIDISHQDHMAPRCTHIATLDTDHSPFASRVSETADILEWIVRGVETVQTGDPR